MKNISLILIGALIILSWASCRSDIEDAIDCTVESTFLEVEYIIDEANPLLVHFAFINSDTVANRFTLEQSIRWEFGDGSETTTDDFTAMHEYQDAGTYDVKAHYVLSRDDNSCSGYKEKTITLE
ncbi:MAG: PKD domain-containing protein [Bacteroidales bacterium]